MKKITAYLIACMALCIGAYSAGFVVEISADEESAVSADISVSDGNAVVGHFGLFYNAEKLEPAYSDGTVLPAELPEKNTDGKSSLSDIVRSAGSHIVITPETNKVSDLVNRSAGTVLFGWYATKEVEAVTAENGAVATVKFRLKDGFSLSDISEGDIAPVTSAQTAGISGWSSGIIIGASDGVQYTFESADPSKKLDIDVMYGFETEKGEDSEKNESEAAEEKKDAEDTEEKTSENTPPTEETESKNTNVSDGELTAEANTYSDRIRFFWEYTGEYAENSFYCLTVKDKFGGTVKKIDGIVSEARSVTVKNLAPDYEFEYCVGLYGEDGTLICETTAEVKTEADRNAELVAFDVFYDAGKGTLYGFDSEKVIFGSTPTKSPEIFAPDGYAFDGWSPDGENTVSLDGYRIYADTVFNAVYTAEKD